MKFEIGLHKTETKTVELEAASRDEAYRKARSENPGFDTDVVTEVTEHDDGGTDHVLIGECENCECLLWEDVPYINDEEGVQICMECAKHLDEANPHS